jgi:hypothetical protein
VRLVAHQAQKNSLAIKLIPQFNSLARRADMASEVASRRHKTRRYFFPRRETAGANAGFLRPEGGF